MVAILAVVVSSLMLVLAITHLYWAHGGNWPGTDRQDLVDKVYGEGTRFPSAIACYVVAVALIAAGILPLFSTGILSMSELGDISWANYPVALVFLIRGLAGYLPALERKWTRVFVRYNRTIYGPLCIGLGASFAFLGGQ